MIYKVYPSLNDFENLSRLKVESSDFANDFDYTNMVVNKPWGYEYLWFQNEKVAIWFLRVKKGQSTSLHCHAKKKTSLIVLDGAVQCTTIDDKYELKTLEAVVLEPCVFHSSMATDEDGAFIMEIETPPMKGDLVRMNDSYGRQTKGYERTHEYSTDFKNYEYKPFEESLFDSWKFKNVEIKLSHSLLKIEDLTEMVVSISGHVTCEKEIVFETGEAVLTSSDIPFHQIQNERYKFLIFNRVK